MAYTTIDDPEAYFQTVLYTGDGNDSRTITLPADTDMQPDMIWIKERSSTSSHYLTSIGMGIGTRLEPDGTSVESTEGLSAVTSDGFTIGTSTNQVNQNTITHVAWCWKESATAGFDIVTYTGNGSARTISHSLSAVPHLMILKSRTYAENWQIYNHKMASDPETDYLEFRNTAIADSAGTWNDTAPTSSVFSVGDRDATNKNTYTYINYLWTEKQGFSKFGSYTGNGNADGTFIHLSFRPAWIMFKHTSDTQSWYIYDVKRRTYNVMNTFVKADTSQAESTSGVNIFDVCSNGIKIRGDGSVINTNGVTYIYAAFAEAPFVNSNGVPCNAR